MTAYGQPQITYGHAGSTYGSWAAASPGGGGWVTPGRPRPNPAPPSSSEAPTQHGRISWVYVITGTGTFEGVGSIDLTLSGRGRVLGDDQETLALILDELEQLP